MTKKGEAKKLKRPETTGSDISTPEKSEELISLLDEYIDQLEKDLDELKLKEEIAHTAKDIAQDAHQKSHKELQALKKERDELKEANLLLEKERKRLNGLIEDGITRYYESKQQELQALKDAVDKHLELYFEIDIEKSKDNLKSMIK